jgi:hypothetical protein
MVRYPMHMWFAPKNASLMLHCGYFIDALSVPALAVISRLQAVTEMGAPEQRLPEMACEEVTDFLIYDLPDVSASPSGNWIASFTNYDSYSDLGPETWRRQSQIFLWKMPEREKGGTYLPTHSIKMPPGIRIEGLMFAPASDLLFVWSSKDTGGSPLTTIDIFNPENGKLQSSTTLPEVIPSERSCGFLTPLGDGSELLCIGERTGDLFLVNLDGKKVEWQTSGGGFGSDEPSKPTAMAMDKGWVAIALLNDRLLIVDLARRRTREIRAGGSISGLAWLPGQAVLFIAVKDSCEITFFSALSLRSIGAQNLCRQNTPHLKVHAIATSADGAWFAARLAVFKNSTIALFRVQTQKFTPGGLSRGWESAM